MILRYVGDVLNDFPAPGSQKTKFVTSIRRRLIEIAEHLPPSLQVKWLEAR